MRSATPSDVSVYSELHQAQMSKNCIDRSIPAGLVCGDMSDEQLGQECSLCRRESCCVLICVCMPQQVIWAALFALAVLVREGSTPHSPALRAIAAAGMLPILENVLTDYKVQSHRPMLSTVGGQGTA